MKRSVILLAVAVTLGAWPFRAQADEHKYALALLHYNLEYVAGGGAYFEDLIVTESFEPVLDLMLAHPAWGINLELQGYMIEVLNERFPQVLTKLRTLVNNGQCAVQCFHYADQLWLAYPPLDMHRSAEKVQQIFADNNLVLSPTVFTQEGQFGEGMADFFPSYGYTIGLLPKNLYRYFHRADLFYPWYDLNGLNVVVGGKGGSVTSGSDTVTTTWTFFNDGELLATNGMAPYGGPLFKHDPAAVTEYEAELSTLERQGYAITTVEKYVAELGAMSFPRQTLEPIVDGTWQPDDTFNVFRWMGGLGEVPLFDQDNRVLTSNYRSRNQLVGAEAMAAYARRHGLDTTQEEHELPVAWKEQLAAEVSDSTGWNPLWMEVDYSLNNSALAYERGWGMINGLFFKLGMRGGTYYLDTYDQNLVSTPPSYSPLQFPAVQLLWGGQGRTTGVTWEAADADANVSRVSLAFSASTTGGKDAFVQFEFNGTDISYTPALLDEVATYPLSAFDLNEVYVPLHNGLMGLGNDWWVIKHCETVHVAGMVSRKDPWVTFKDLTAPVEEGFTWIFTVVHGTADKALEVANHVNAWPLITYHRDAYVTPTPTRTPRPTPTPTPVVTQPPPPTSTPTPAPNQAPSLRLAGYWDSRVSLGQGGSISAWAYVYDPEGESFQEVVLSSLGGEDGVALNSRGGGLFAVGPSEVPAGMPPQRLIFQIRAWDSQGASSGRWPYLEVR